MKQAYTLCMSFLKKYKYFILAFLGILIIIIFISFQSSDTPQKSGKTNLLPINSLSISIDSTEPTPIAKELFGVALNDYGNTYREYGTNPTWNKMIEEIGFTSGAYTAGAEDHWIHPTPVGMGANLEEIFENTNSTEGAYKLQQKHIETGIDFWDVTTDYVKTHNQQMVFTANVLHGTESEMATFINSLIAKGITNYKIRYGQEVSIGEGFDTSGEYITALKKFDDYASIHYPNAPRVVNMARENTPRWDNAEVYAWAKSRGIEEFSQYFWLDGKSTETQIDKYFTDENQKLQASLYNTILPRIADYQTSMPDMKLHMGQYGVSLQRSGYSAHTMLHGILIWNFLFEVLEFNSTHDNFVNSGIFLVNESAVDPRTSADTAFTIEPDFVGGSGNAIFVKRIPGVAYEMLNTIFRADNPQFLQTNIGTDLSGIGAIAVKTDKTRLYIYNNGEAKTLSSISIDNETFESKLYRESVWSEKPYGSIGFSPAYSKFKASGYSTPVNVQLEKGEVDVMNGITLPSYSINVFELK